jgi:hypothetical protein
VNLKKNHLNLCSQRSTKNKRKRKLRNPIGFMGYQKAKTTCPLWKIQEEERGKKIECLFKITGDRWNWRTSL